MQTQTSAVPRFNNQFFALGQKKTACFPSPDPCSCERTPDAPLFYNPPNAQIGTFPATPFLVKFVEEISACRGWKPPLLIVHLIFLPPCSADLLLLIPNERTSPALSHCGRVPHFLGRSPPFFFDCDAIYPSTLKQPLHVRNFSDRP